MTTERIRVLISELRDNVFVSKESIATVEKRLRSGELTEQEAYSQLRSLDPTYSKEPFSLTAERIDDEWRVLANVIDQAETRAEKMATRQFFVGLLALPVVVILILMSLSFGWYEGEEPTVVGAVLAACLVAIGAHSFFVLRIHQQASLAAERLSEKRVGMFFLRIALSRDNPEDSAALLSAGTAMFLGHHAAATIPLQAADYSATLKA